MPTGRAELRIIRSSGRLNSVVFPTRLTALTTSGNITVTRGAASANELTRENTGVFLLFFKLHAQGAVLDLGKYGILLRIILYLLPVEKS